ncbi:MAG: sulfatase [Prolixibacteraceae bacterium]|jgi:arylsulfatase A-like enzyme|nr:sulfatase [Prolixibacteraceae bacterium]MBT6766900.1 sulfatase [Prolixibacteraceae bacterium]MBT7000279.1 sulfatase [Prolixibacteraceae bacterium]MBT7394018.1 sulfatase [Prolixibacteraceae bacterium]
MKTHTILFSTLFLFGILSACSEPEKPLKEPNILFIMTDDHSYQTLSAYSNKLIETPNLDRIANEGVLFKNSFVGNSICAPSRATLLTGKHTHKNGQINNSHTFDGGQVTFPKLLQQAGYQTALVGKWHLKSDPTGFDYWNILPGQGQYYNPDFIEMGEKKQFEGYCTTLTTDFGLNWLENRDKEKPFCLLLHHKAPHRTWQPDTIHFAEFKDKVYPVPENFFDNYEGRLAAAEQKLSIRAADMDIQYDLKMEDSEGRIVSRFPRMKHTSRMNELQKNAWEKHYKPITKDFLGKDLEGDELYLWKYQRYMRDYLACIRSVDENVGRVLDYLKENGLDENTLVVYTSDQGFYMGEHGWFDKRFMYEQSLRTPLLMRLPKGYSKKGEIAELVQNIDFAPTFLDFAGVDIPAEIQGKSLKPILSKEKNIEWRDGIYYHYYEFPNEHAVKRHYGIRTDRYKLIHFYNDIDEWELYDLQTDLEEMDNLINSEKHVEIIIGLKTELTKLQVLYEDTDRSTY